MEGTRPLRLAEGEDGTVVLDGEAPQRIALAASLLAEAPSYLAAEDGFLVVCGTVKYRPVAFHGPAVIVCERA